MSSGFEAVRHEYRVGGLDWAPCSKSDFDRKRLAFLTAAPMEFRELFAGDDVRQLAEERAELLEALNRAFDLIALVGNPVKAGGGYDKNGAWTFADALPRDADAKAVGEAFDIIANAIALATQRKEPGA